MTRLGTLKAALLVAAAVGCLFASSAHAAAQRRPYTMTYEVTEDAGGNTQVRGQVTNHTRRTIRVGTYVIRIYGANGRALETVDYGFVGLSPGQSGTFLITKRVPISRAELVRVRRYR